jgi:hypothetical protein
MFGRFGRRFGPPFGGGDWEGWTPPWMQRGWQGPRGPRFFGGHHHHGFPGPWQRGQFGPGAWQWGSPEFQALRSEAAEVARLFAIASQGAIENRERLGQLRAFLDRSRKELSDMIYGTTGQTEGQSSTPDVGQA